MTTVNQYFLKALKNEGITHIFLVPGGWVDQLVFDIANDPDLKAIVTAHEEGAAFMADGYSRSSRRFGTCVCLSGPGITNTVTGIATAKTDLSPLLVVSGEVSQEHQGRGAFQDSSSYGIDSYAILQSITAMQMRVTNPQQFQRNLERLLRKMLSHSSKGPVHLSLPADMQVSPVSGEYEKLPEIIYNPRFIDENATKQLWGYLVKSKKIAILAGSGIRHSGAEQELLKFAERFQIPVATTLGGKGAIPENHPLSLGLLGWFGHRPASELILSKEVEILFVVGSRLNQFDTIGWTDDFRPRKMLILNDINTDSVFRNFHVDFPIVGDARTLLEKLNDTDNKYTSELCSSNSERKQWIEHVKNKGSFFYDTENLLSEKIPIHPARVIHELRQAMPEETVLYADCGAHSFFAAHYWLINHPSKFVSTVKYLGAMGWAIPAVMGAKFARPDLPHVVVTGDGCMLMHGVEIQTAARYNLPLIVVIMNNSALGNPLLRSEKIGLKEAELDKLPTHDWVKFAESLGAVGLKVENPEDLKPTFEKALKLNKTVVIDIITGNYPTPTQVFDKYYYGKE